MPLHHQTLADSGNGPLELPNLTSVCKDLDDLLSVRAKPLDIVIVRLPRSTPQYNVVHPARVAHIDDEAKRLPCLALAGANFGGVGIPDNVRGRGAARHDARARVDRRNTCGFADVRSVALTPRRRRPWQGISASVPDLRSAVRLREAGGRLRHLRRSART